MGFISLTFFSCFCYLSVSLILHFGVNFDCFVYFIHKANRFEKNSNFAFVNYSLRLISEYTIWLKEGARSSEGGISYVIFNLPQPLNSVGRIFLAALTPPPIIYNRIEDNFLSIGTAFQFLFSGFLVVGFIKIYRTTFFLPLTLAFFITFFGYAFGSFTFRHITQWFPLAVIISLIGYSQCIPRNRFGIILIAISFLFLGSVIYIFIK